MRLLINLVIIIYPLLACSGNSGIKEADKNDSLQNDTAENYPYDTVLKGGYVLSFQMDRDIYHLYLKKSNFRSVAINVVIRLTVICQ